MKDTTLKRKSLTARRNLEVVRLYRTGKWGITALGERYGMQPANVAHLITKTMTRNGIVRGVKHE